MEDIRAIEALYAFAESKGLLDRVRSLRAGAVHLELDPPKPALSPSVVGSSDTPADESDAERRDLEALLWSVGGDATPFLREAQ